MTTEENTCTITIEGEKGTVAEHPARKGLSSDCKLDPMIVIAILMGGREHPCDRCNIDRNVCRGYPRQ